MSATKTTRKAKPKRPMAQALKHIWQMSDRSYVEMDEAMRALAVLEIITDVDADRADKYVLRDAVGCAFDVLEPILQELRETLHNISVACTSADPTWESPEAVLARHEKLMAETAAAEAAAND